MSRYSCTEPAALKMENLVCQKINHSLATIYKILILLKCLSILVVNLLFTEISEYFSDNHGRHIQDVDGQCSSLNCVCLDVCFSDWVF